MGQVCVDPSNEALIGRLSAVNTYLTYIESHTYNKHLPFLTLLLTIILCRHVGFWLSFSGFNTPFCLTFRHNVTVCIGETLAQLPDRAKRLNNWAAAATALAAGVSTRSATVAGVVAGTSLDTKTTLNKIKNNTGNSTAASGGGVFLLSQLRELPHVLVVNEWGLHHHR